MALSLIDLQKLFGIDANTMPGLIDALKQKAASGAEAVTGAASTGADLLTDLYHNPGRIAGFVADPQARSDMVQNAREVGSGIARGGSAGLLGAPVDIVNTMMAGAGGGSPVMGNNWIEKKMVDAGIMPPRYGTGAETVGELASGVLNPALAAERAGPALFNAEQAAVRNAMTGEPIIAGSPFAQAGAINPRLKNNPLLGAFPTTTAGRIVNETLGPGGGYSVNMLTGQRPTEGLMMGKYANTDPRNTVVAALLRRPDVEQSVFTNREALSKQENFLSTWRDPDTGKTYIDIAKRFEPEDIRKATKYGERTRQIAGYDVGKSASFPVGNWEEFVKSPEFAARVVQMEKEGGDYLKNFPAKEWWDMHGGPFERVYGPENLRPLAGYISSTAPMAAPRENLQTMSEYMRRHITGEPIVQPDWRVPAGEMTRTEGGKIGNEQLRAANLLKSQQVDLGALQMDKVREEAKALMGDPTAVVLDRHWARLAENPSAGVYTAAQEGIISAGKQYDALKASVTNQAALAGQSPRDFSARVWTGIREHIKNNSELFGQKFRGSAITGESKSYADHFESLIEDKAKHLGISKQEMESRLRKGDATLMSAIISAPIGAWLYSVVTGQQPEPNPVQ